MKVSDISNAGVVSARAMVLQQKTDRPVQFEVTEQTREAISEWMLLLGVTITDMRSLNFQMLLNTYFTTPIRYCCSSTAFSFTHCGS